MFYLVSNRSGTGKTIVHRPRPPSPQEGNFDALPRAPSNDFALKISRPRKRPALAIRTSPPPVERRLDSPSLESKYMWLDPVRATWNSIRRRNRNRDHATGNAQHSKGKQRAADPHEDDDERPPDTAKTQDIRAWVMGKSAADVQRSATYPHRQSPVSKSPNHKKARRTTQHPDMFSSIPGTSSLGKHVRGPPPGQTYEIVNRQIIEKRPDKTVELSTWKEQNEKAVCPTDAERISVYYVTAGELELGEDRENIQVEWRFDGPSNDADTPQRVPSSVTASKVGGYCHTNWPDAYLFDRGLRQTRYLFPEDGNQKEMSFLRGDTAPSRPAQAKRRNPQEAATRPLRNPRMLLHLRPTRMGTTTPNPHQSKRIFLPSHSIPRDPARRSAAYRRNRP